MREKEPEIKKKTEDSAQNISKKKSDKRKKVLKLLFSKTSKEDKKVSDKEKMEALMEVAMATEELRQLKKEYGIEEQQPKENEKAISVNKKKYIWLALLTGWFGGHRFYVKQYKVALIYLLFSWMGIGLYHSMVDIMIVIPMKPDENGNIMV